LSGVWQTSNETWKVGFGIRTFASKRIITKWEEVPDDYEDAAGLEFRDKPFTQAETIAVFGKGIDVNSANRLLTVLHGRRVAGTLEEPDAGLLTNFYELNAQSTALKWLRENVPVDEERSAGLEAEKALAEMENDIITDSERIGLCKPRSTPDAPGSKRKFRGEKSPYGESGLDAIRAAKEKELDEKERVRERKLSQADEIRQNTGTLEPVTARQRVELRRKGENPWLQHYINRAKGLETPPEMTIRQRLGPSGLFVIAIIAICLVFPLVYTPPKNSQRMWPDVPPAAATIIALVTLNLLLYFAWHHPPLFRIMNKYFITTPGLPNPFSLLGNIFSHTTFAHLATNMLVLALMGTRLHDEVGRANFLSIYIGSGTIGSLVSLSSYVLRNSFISSSLGASGAVAGIIAAHLWLNKNEAVWFFGTEHFFNMPCWIPLAFIMGIDAFALTKWNRTPITLDHWAHLGGYFSGIAGAELVRMRWRYRKKVEMERRRNLGVVDRVKEGRL